MQAQKIIETEDDYSIAVVTYHARFESFFMPLVKKLSTVFPDKEILCVLNGHPDKTLQMKYLDKATSFLHGIPNARYLSYDQHQSLAKCWNQTIILSNTGKVLIINDDTQVTELFRQEFETKALRHDFTLINYSWSHFLTSKKTVRAVGWFDERLLGIGYEDVDYAFRMTIKDQPVHNTTCLGIENYVAPQEDVSWKDISEKIAGMNRYSAVNLEFFKTKWWHVDIDKEFKDWTYTLQIEGDKTLFAPKEHCDTPLFYELSVLEKNPNKTSHGTLSKENEAAVSKTSNTNTRTGNPVVIFIQKLKYGTRALLKKIYRSFW